MFDVSSPNGYLLFREVSKMIVSYGMYVQLHVFGVHTGVVIMW